jgi:hypothetical protein
MNASLSAFPGGDRLSPRCSPLDRDENRLQAWSQKCRPSLWSNVTVPPGRRGPAFPSLRVDSLLIREYTGAARNKAHR